MSFFLGDEAEAIVVKDQLNRGTFCGCKDINVVAGLIKVKIGCGTKIIVLGVV